LCSEDARRQSGDYVVVYVRWLAPLRGQAG
jgi:hypothetical protein